MANPSGTNGLTPQPRYGDIKKQQGLTQAAPIAGSPTSAINAPRTAQRQAVRGSKGRGKPPKPPKVLKRPPDAFHPTSAPPAEPQPPGTAQIWSEIAAIPGVTPLAQELAARAASGGS